MPTSEKQNDPGRPARPVKKSLQTPAPSPRITRELRAPREPRAPRLLRRLDNPRPPRIQRRAAQLEKAVKESAYTLRRTAGGYADIAKSDQLPGDLLEYEIAIVRWLQGKGPKPELPF